MPYSKNRSTTRKLKRGGQRPTQRPTRKELTRVTYKPIRPTRINNMTATFTKPTAITEDGQNFSISFPFFKPKRVIKGGKTRKIRRKSQRKRQH
jgi:hypothetical protein